MYNLRAAISKNGITVYYNVETDDAERKALFKELGANAGRPEALSQPGHFRTHFGWSNGLTRDSGIIILKRLHVGFEETR
jgi:hypothetical protein